MPSVNFSTMFPTNPSQIDHVHHALEQVAALDVADEIDQRLIPHHLAGFAW